MKIILLLLLLLFTEFGDAKLTTRMKKFKEVEHQVNFDRANIGSTKTKMTTVNLEKKIGGTRNNDCFVSGGYLRCERTGKCLRWWEKYHSFDEMVEDCAAV